MFLMKHVEKYLAQAKSICDELDGDSIEGIVDSLVSLREGGGRLFILGAGGSAANASHAVNDFRKLCDIECYAPTDNVSELTARTNDEGWDSVFVEWLKTSRLNESDGVLVFSVGGGSEDKNISVNIIHALKEARQRGSTILGIVGRNGGFTAEVANISVIVPTVDSALVTPHTEAFQALIWHCLVSHPKLQLRKTKW